MLSLRVPSELLPPQLDGPHNTVRCLGNEVCEITLNRRKSMQPAPSVLRRSCCCATQGKNSCFVHLLKDWLGKVAVTQNSRHNIFGTSYTQFMKKLRRHAALLPGALNGRVGSHAFRRGMTSDLLKGGGRLSDILVSGGWRSSAFQCYLEKAEVDQLAFADMLLEQSDSEGEAEVGEAP